MKKISIVGVGRVGESVAQMIAMQELTDQLVLVDIRNKYAEGVALDLQEAGWAYGTDCKIIGGSGMELIKDSGIVIITAGIPRRPGMSRDEVISVNLKIIKDVMADVEIYAHNSIVIMVTNPVDVLTYVAYKNTSFPRERIMGQAGILDSMRMAAFISIESGVSVKDINAFVIGGHGDTMVPLTRNARVNGISITEMLEEDAIESIIKRTRNGGGEVLALKGNSSASIAPGAAVAIMVDSIVNDRSRLLPCISVLHGEYGHTGVAIGVPIVLNAKGVVEVKEIGLDSVERLGFDESVFAAKKMIEKNR